MPLLHHVLLAGTTLVASVAVHVSVLIVVTGSLTGKVNRSLYGWVAYAALIATIALWGLNFHPLGVLVIAVAVASGVMGAMALLGPVRKPVPVEFDPAATRVTRTRTRRRAHQKQQNRVVARLSTAIWLFGAGFTLIAGALTPGLV